MINQELQTLETTARADLSATRTTTDAGIFFRAGARQFGSFWTRDFCLAVPGLLRLGETAAVAAQIRVLLQMRGPDGVVPRGFDVTNPKWRVLRHTALRWLPGSGPGHRGPLHAEHLGEHGTPALDSNALILNAIGELPESFRTTLAGEFDLSWLLKPYVSFLKNGLIHQPPFSDWQDSARREGPGLFMHVVLLKALRVAEKMGLSTPIELERKAFAERVSIAFHEKETGLFAQTPGTRQIPLEANLWIAEGDLFETGGAAHFEKLRRHPLWTRAGIPVSTFSPAREIAWTTKAVGLRHYHDGLVWSWLLADQARIAALFGDRESAGKITTEQAQAAAEFGTIHEVYERIDGRLVPFRRALYASEGPFTWGAGRWLETVSRMKYL